ncbi:GTPase [Desulforhopalus sp. 52FAK]
MKKKLIILSGFLGSGKTSFLSQLLHKFKDRKLAVLLNDFGEAPVDSSLLDLTDLENCDAKDRLVELSGGSVFCSCLKDSFVQALVNLAESDAEILIIEASGMSDPAGMKSLLWMAKLNEVYEEPSVLCLFDPIKSWKLSHVLEVIPRQVKAANVVVITKTDIASDKEIRRAVDYIEKMNDQISIYKHHLGDSGGMMCLSDEGNLVSSTRVETQGNLFGFNTKENRPDSFIVSSAPQGVEPLLHFLNENEDVLRVKGYLYDGERHLYVSDTGRGFKLEPCEDKDVPLTIICMKGTGVSIQNALLQQNLITQ